VPGAEPGTSLFRTSQAIQEPRAMTRWVEETFNPHFRCALEADEVLYEGNTGFQDLIIFDNKTFGRVMVLDGVIQLTEKDEFIYHEMMSHVPLFALERPESVLIIGGGDGGVLREVLKHRSVKSVMHCEIDKGVVDQSLKFLPGISAGAFDDPRVELMIGDGIKFVNETDRRFDVIIVDSTEPIGPARVLFTEEFFAACQRCLTPGGVFIGQNGLPFLYPEHLADSGRILRKLFADAACFMCTQPAYFGGPFALAWAGNDPETRHVHVSTLAARYEASGIKTRYYNPAVHTASFVLPNYVADAWGGAN
jgi:spermidine synthase